jgi:hypothetical protein
LFGGFFAPEDLRFRGVVGRQCEDAGKPWLESRNLDPQIAARSRVAALYCETVLIEELVMVHEWGVKGERNAKLYCTVTATVLPGVQGGGSKAWLDGQHWAITVIAL